MPAMRGKAHFSFSQFGEDIIIESLIRRYGVSPVTYLDIGANEPITGSNTYGFYLRGERGVLVEPNKDLCNSLKSVRPGDLVLNFGIGGEEEGEADYYMFGRDHTHINTFSAEEAKNNEKEGFPIREVVKVPLKNINNIIHDYLNDKAPVLLSLDVEGLDEEILKTLDFDRYQPLLVCVETVTFSLNKQLVKRQPILDFMESKGYFVYADTHVNTIFCSKREFDKLIPKD